MRFGAMAWSMLFCLSSLVLTGSLRADDLVSAANSEAIKQQHHNQQREQRFTHTVEELKALNSELQQQKAELETQIQSLSERFRGNEQTLADLELALKTETGTLSEVFALVRQHANTLQSAQQQSSVPQPNATAISIIAESRQLPSIEQVDKLWRAYLAHIKASGEIRATVVTEIDAQGLAHENRAVKLGAFALIGEQGFLQWQAKPKTARYYTNQPPTAPTLASVEPLLLGSSLPLLIDPTRGELLQQRATSLTLLDRIQQGGPVAQVIIALLLVGLIIAVVRGIHLVAIRRKINQQLKSPSAIHNNPLGRVLAVYQNNHNRSVEALELRLLETVLDEQAHLDKGLSMLKLLAALAPMLGLLGTVIGMIETFQIITQYGNGDPKVMAGGISMALVTTVLGLVAAMPLLLAHNLLSSQVEAIKSILEKQGVALVAKQAESELATPASGMASVA
ncbi:MotA/TolQ/ExbB proton channel family protein [Vibrio sinaloensis]|uniref:MotA/TolQ/ExbB proton channel family protein n=1 Tax=Photobacterium sp. (strain ATCC 43367) TaxID=379097 RepID=UPI00206ABF9C|nr:MotA/TolQ/ExbB proton channel family protein [Vibrio sinaloensis]UPQ89105.1 MotA/TolQ/ExbB proton channel family protein [Vibrio sinaloensis]